MKRNPLLYLAIVVASAIVVWFVERPELPRLGHVEKLDLFAGLDTSKVDRVEIEHLINGVELRRDGETWKVYDLTTDTQTFFNADPELVKKLLETLKNLKVETVISTNPEKQAQFQVNKIGLQIRAYDKGGNKISHLYIGKGGPDLMSTYIRRDGDNNVYLVKQYLGPQFRPELEKWKDKGIWQKLLRNYPKNQGK